MTKYDLDHEMISRDEDPSWEIREYNSDEISNMKVNYLLTGLMAGFILGMATGIVFITH